MSAQQGSSATVYGEVRQRGEARSYTSAVGDLDAGMRINSVRTEGGPWQVCTGNNFRGRCMIVDGDLDNVKGEFGFFSTIQSMRPASEASAASAAPAAPPANATTATPPVASGEGMRGTAAQFFPQPLWNGAPIAAGDAAALSAFCRAAGFGRVASSGSALRGGADIAVDLLCTEPDSP
ncbi:hypothetical protein H6P80_06020 [Parasphingopyxis sp. GrpM-11]|uniref:Beta/gamma crystallin 'Greek key' domain-containing protein n=2 Tax=Parasphingopyxis marina TaxID=2761622 RepID=A0A842I090_9SPHN|nr:hypothetical protein [Parasphingopyxis marina]